MQQQEASDNLAVLQFFHSLDFLAFYDLTETLGQSEKPCETHKLLRRVTTPKMASSKNAIGKAAPIHSAAAATKGSHPQATWLRRIT